MPRASSLACCDCLRSPLLLAVPQHVVDKGSEGVSCLQEWMYGGNHYTHIFGVSDYMTPNPVKNNQQTTPRTSHVLAGVERRLRTARRQASGTLASTWDLHSGLFPFSGLPT